MLIVDSIAWILFVYLTSFVLYRTIVIWKSSEGRLADVHKRSYGPDFDRKFSIVIYSHNNSAKVKQLIETFSEQTYSKENFSINVILDNCDSENDKLLELFGRAKLWRLNTEIKPLGKYKAFAWLMERIRAVENTNAFLFLDAECKIKKDLLEKANISLADNSVVAGETIKRKNFFYNRLANFRNQINSRVFRHGRTYLKLGNFIDTDILLIKQEVLEKIDFELFSDGFEEYEYPLKLRYFNIPVVYSSDLVVYKNIEETLKSTAFKDYKRRYRTFRTFLRNFNLLFTKSKFSVKESVLSLAHPSGTVFVFSNLMLLYISLVYTTTNFSQIITANIVGWLLVSRILTDLYALVVLRGSYRNYYYAASWALLSPIIFLRSLLIGFTATSAPKKIRSAKTPEAINFEKHTAEATITDGKKEFPCQIELTKTVGVAKAVFIFNDKRLSSSKQPRMCYAIDEIIEKLKKHGFCLKVCSNCGYFHMTESVSAHNEGEKGYCLFKNFKENTKEKELTPVWESCADILPVQARAYILQQLGIESKKPTSR